MAADFRPLDINEELPSLEQQISQGGQNASSLRDSSNVVLDKELEASESLDPDCSACEQSPFFMLPVELHHKIFSYLNHIELATVSVVCREWRRLVMAPLLWRNLTISQTCDVGGVCIFKGTPFLRSLTLNLDSMLEVIHVTLHLVMCCPKLSSLNMRFCRGVNVRCISLLVTFCPCIEEINLEGCEEVDDEVIAAVLGFSKLRRLNLSHCRRISNKAIKDIAATCETLEFLDINGNTFITDDRKNEMCGKDIRGNDGRCLLHEAVVILLSGGQCILTWREKARDFIAITPMLTNPKGSITVLASSRKTSLRKLYIDGESLTDASYFALSQCAKLTTLQIWYVERMTDEGLLALMSLKELTTLEIRQAKELSSEGLTMLFEGGNLSKLVILNLSGCHQIQDSTVKVLSQSCPNLQQLMLSWCWEITDVGLESIENHCRYLTHLDLTGLLLLKGNCLHQIPELLPRLRYLDVQQCSEVTDEILERLYQMMPTLVIFNYYGEVVTMDMCNEAISKQEAKENVMFVLSDAVEMEPS